MIYIGCVTILQQGKCWVLPIERNCISSILQYISEKSTQYFPKGSM